MSLIRSFRVADKSYYNQYKLDNGEEYFIQSTKVPSVTALKVSKTEDITLVPNSVLSLYTELDFPMIFVKKSGIVVCKVKDNEKWDTETYTLKEELDCDTFIKPFPLVTTDMDDLAVIEANNQIRAIVTKKYIDMVEDCNDVLNVLNSTTLPNIDYITETLSNLPELISQQIDETYSIQEGYEEEFENGILEINDLICKYNKLLSAVERFLEIKHDIEAITFQLVNKAHMINKLKSEI